MAEIVDLRHAIRELVSDGDEVALEGFSHLVPFAAGDEIARQRRRGLTVDRMVPDILVDRLIGMGCVRKLVFSWAGNPGVGSLHRFRDAVEQGWPSKIELEEHTHAGMANRYAAGASGLPFAILRAYAGTDLARHTNVRLIACPFTGATVAAVPALRPDVGIIHAQRADRSGTVQLWGIVGVQKEAILCARRSLATVEEVVSVLEPVPGAVVIPSWAIDFVSEARGGAYPSYADGFSDRDDGFYERWDDISRDRQAFLAWMDEHVLRGLTGV